MKVFHALQLALVIAILFIPPEYSYVRYVTLGQCAKVLAELLEDAFFPLVASLAILFFLPQSAKPYFAEVTIDFIPNEVWFVVWFALLTWLLKGLKVELPRATVKQWLFINVMVAVLAGIIELAYYHLSFTAWAFLSYGVWNFVRFYGGLVREGKANYECSQQQLNFTAHSGE